MSCLLPPLCLFCTHYHHSESSSQYLSCAAFNQIPDEIFNGRVSHTVAYPGDSGITFQLNQTMQTEFDEINELRQQMNLQPYPVSSDNLLEPKEVFNPID